jgi:hypothetical protein
MTMVMTNVVGVHKDFRFVRHILHMEDDKNSEFQTPECMIPNVLLL